MKRKLLSEQICEIRSKLKALIDKWTSQLATSKCEFKECGRIVDYILRNQKCKLPWSINETEIAMQMTEKLFMPGI